MLIERLELRDKTAYVIMVEVLSFTFLDEVANALGDEGLELERIFQCVQSAGGLWLGVLGDDKVDEINEFVWLSDHANSRSSSVLHQVADVDVRECHLAILVAEITSSHAQVFDELVGVLALLAGGVEEQLGKAWSVDAVLREVGSHREILQRSCNLHFNLSFRLLHAGILHVNEFDVGEETFAIGCACKR